MNARPLGEGGHIVTYQFYVHHFRSFVYDFTAINKRTTQMIFLYVDTQDIFSTKCNHQHSTNLSHLYGKQSTAALYSSLLDNVKRP
jgi:hypothetical protein